MWIAGLAVIAAIAATYRLTRPPALVWWTSPAMGSSGKHARMLIPEGWELYMSFDSGMDSSWSAEYNFRPGNVLTSVLEWLLHTRRDSSSMRIEIVTYGTQQQTLAHINTDTMVIGAAPNQHRARRLAVARDRRAYADLTYERSNLTAFTRTYRQICNSLRIE